MTMSAERDQSSKRRCVSTACIACRRRKSKCDGNLPSCAACSSVYRTACVYDPNSDHRRKGVYRKDTDTLRTRNTTLQTIIQAILNYEEDDAFELVRQIRACADLENVAEAVIARDKGHLPTAEATTASANEGDQAPVNQFEAELAGKVSELLLDGSRKFIGGTSNLIFLPRGSELHESSTPPTAELRQDYPSVKRWTRVTDDETLLSHLMTMYFTWHYPFYTVLAKDVFYRDYVSGVSSQYCSSLLVNAILALGCHFTSYQGALEDPQDLATAGNHFFREAKRLVLEHDEHENAKLCTVQAFALMSVHEAGCGREGKGWVYSGLSFRMAFDLGLNLDASSLGAAHNLTEEEIDARRVTFWGCYMIDKYWSNYLGRQPQLSSSNAGVRKFDVLPREEIELWSPYTDSGVNRNNAQPSRTRAVALHISKLCEISGDLLVFFYHPADVEKAPPKQLELKKLSEVHTRLEAWKKELPKELEPKEGQLPQMLVTHMFYQLLLIHLYRPFLKYTKSSTPLPAHVSPRKMCTQAASAISKLLRIYKRSYGLRQICNIVVYMAHTACTIHILNLPDKNAQRDIIHGLKNLEEMADAWLCARRTIRILDISAHKWQVGLPAEAVRIIERTHSIWGSWGSWDQATSPSTSEDPPAMNLLTCPSGFNPPVPPHPDAFTSAAPSGMATAAIPSQYPATTTIPPSFQQSKRAASHILNTQIRGPDLAPPEPTYLRPISQGSYQFPALSTSDLSSAPLGNTIAWYDASLHPPNATTNPTILTASPTAAFDGGTENLVEESQDWWSRNAATLGIGVETWGEGWGNSLAGSQPPYAGNNDAHGSVGIPDPTTGHKTIEQWK